MSWREVLNRLTAGITSRIDLGRFRKPRLLVSRLHAAAFQPFVLKGTNVAGPYVTAAENILKRRQRVFAIEYDAGEIPNWNRDPKTGRQAPMRPGKRLNYRNEALVGDIKYLWEPNRHLHLVTLAQAWVLSNDCRYADGLKTQLRSWIDQCPYSLGPNWTSTLELAIRLINWSVVWQLVGGYSSRLFDEAEGERLRESWLNAIYRHMDFVQRNFSRFSSANNHLIGEASGLFVGSVTWPYWSECDRWRKQGKEILEREINLQTSVDGVNREQAIAYQQFVLDFFLLAAVAGRTNNHDFSASYWRSIESMLEYLASIMDVGGNVPMFGDSDDGYVVNLSPEPDFCPYRSLLATGALLFRRPEFKAKAGRLDDKSRWLIGPGADEQFEKIPSATTLLPIRQAFPEGGVFVLGCNFETDREIRIAADAGPLGYLSIAAHGHSDALSFTLSAGGREILIDPGTYAYHTQREWRDYFRGTAAHNTISVDGENQSLIGGNFMWIRQAQTVVEKWESTSGRDCLVARHDGYMRYRDPVLHRREIELDKQEHRIVVNDSIECQNAHQVTFNWHFSEKCVVGLRNGRLVVSNNGVRAVMSLPENRARVDIYRGSTNRYSGWISRKFDQKQETSTAVLNFPVSGPTRFQTIIDVMFEHESN